VFSVETMRLLLAILAGESDNAVAALFVFQKMQTIPQYSAER
jgi:hypothetical protein